MWLRHFLFLSELESYVFKCTIGNLFFEELCLMHLLFQIFWNCKKHPQSAHKFLFSNRTSIPPIVSQDNDHLVVWFSPTEMELSLLFVVKMQIHSENLQPLLGLVPPLHTFPICEHKIKSKLWVFSTQECKSWCQIQFQLKLCKSFMPATVHWFIANIGCFEEGERRFSVVLVLQIFLQIANIS